MSRSVLPLVLLASFAAPALAADTLPSRKPGLWDVTMNREGMKTALPASQLCIDAGTDKAMLEAALNASQGLCDKKTMSGSGAKRVFDSVCHIGPTAVTSHTEVTFVSPTLYHVDTQSQFDPPLNGRTDSHMTQEGKWTGPCPADMKPGDMKINGMTINVINALNATPH